MEVWGWLRHHSRDGHELGAVGDTQAGEKMCIPTSLNVTSRAPGEPQSFVGPRHGDVN